MIPKINRTVALSCFMRRLGAGRGMMILLLAVALGTTSLTAQKISPQEREGAGVPVYATTQKLAVPAYFYPCTMDMPGFTCYWSQLLEGLNQTGIVVFNPDSGSGTFIRPDYVEQFKRLRARLKTTGGDVKFIGYVATSYGNRSAAAVKADIDNYYLWYQPDGIFFDEGFREDCSRLAYYLDLKNYVRSKSLNAFTVLNPGTDTQECYLTTADVLVTFENTFTVYTTRTAPAWERNYPPSRFWHLVHATPEASMPEAVRLAKTRNVRYLYVTPDTVATNPWDSLPSASYLTTELRLFKTRR